MINYDPHKWLDHFFDIRGSMVREILGRVSLCVLWSVAVVAAYKYGFKLAIPSTIHTLVGLALGLLLVFRTNASYDRFWEGRKLWGGMVNETRNLIRAAAQFLHTDPALLQQLAAWTAAFPFATMNHLRGKQDLGDAASGLPPAEVQAAIEAEHTPMAVAMRMSACLTEARRRGLLTDYSQIAIDQNIQLLVDYLGGCERIRKTPLPFAYVVHLRRALVLYCFTLPFALVDTFGWTTVADTLLLSYVFFGIEEIGVEIEGPFGYDDNDLPLEQICDTIRHNVLALAGARLPEAEPPMPGAL
ncbi:MAG: bestrophin family ion channel [Bryobacteraceae bacterium]